VFVRYLSPSLSLSLSTLVNDKFAIISITVGQVLDQAVRILEAIGTRNLRVVERGGVEAYGCG